MTRRSEILDEGFQICAPDCRVEKDMQARGVRNVCNFLAESIGNPIKADFQCLDYVLLTGEKLPPLFAPLFAPLLAFLLTFLPTFLSQNVCGAHKPKWENGRSDLSLKIPSTRPHCFRGIL